MGISQLLKFKKEGLIYMKLDHDLIRDLLMAYEKKANGRTNFYVEDIAKECLPDYDVEAIRYHSKQLADAGYVKVGTKSSDHIIDLTWKGHQYLANIKDDNIWNIIKNKTSSLSGVTLDIIATMAKEEVKKYLSL